MYELLAQALIYPDNAFAARVWARVQALDAAPSWAVAMLDALIAEPPADLQTEYVRLFVNALGGSPCLPYESVYVEGRVMGEVSREVAALYADWGVEETAELPDYAAVELAFASQLARLRQLPAAEEHRDLVGQTLDAFEHDHLRVWLPRLAADLQAAAESPFYRAVGNALAAVFGTGEAMGRAGRGARSGDLSPDGQA